MPFLVFLTQEENTKKQRRLKNNSSQAKKATHPSPFVCIKASTMLFNTLSPLRMTAKYNRHFYPLDPASCNFKGQRDSE